MKTLYHYIICITLLLSIVATANAQMVRDNIFLKGNHVEVGIAPNGAFGTTVNAPAGYHPNTPGVIFFDPENDSTSVLDSALGFVADPDADGWDVGVPPYFGDYFLPGDPQEGWSIQVDGVRSDAFTPAYLDSGTTGYTGSLMGANIAYSATGSSVMGVWKGTAAGTLAITQTTTLDAMQLYFTMSIMLRNTGSTTLHNIYYLRTVDPDNEERENGSFGTANTIVHQLPDAGNKVLVSATGTEFPRAYLGLGTKDCRALCYIDSFELVCSATLDSIYNKQGHYNYYSGSITKDVGIGLVFNIGDLAPGDTTSFAYAYILREPDLDSAISFTAPQMTAHGVTFNNTDTIYVCNNPTLDSVPVTISNGGYYSWTWAPSTGISSTTGISNNIDINSLNTFTVTGASINPALCDEKIFVIKLIPVNLPVINISGIIQPSLCGAGDASFTISGLSPGLAYTVTYTSDTIHTLSAIADGAGEITVSGLYANTYADIFVSEAVCSSNAVGPVSIINPAPAPILLTYSRNTLCEFDTISVTYSGNPLAGSVFTYTLPVGAVITNGNDTNPAVIRFDSTLNGTVALTVSIGPPECNVVDSFPVSVLRSPVVHFYVQPDICVDDTTPVALSYASNDIINYTWSFNDANILPGNQAVTGPYHVSWGTPGLHTITLLTSNGVCPSTLMIDTIYVHAAPDATFIIGNANNPLCEGDSVLLQANKVLPGNKYEWFPAIDFNNTNRPLIYCNIKASGYIGLKITNEFGCTASDSLFVNVQPCCSIYFPDAFTPNNDGANDVFRPVTIGHHKIYQFVVMNRWGQTVYESTSDLGAWDGNKEGIPQDMNVYFYYLKYDCDGKIMEEKGQVTLIR